MPPKPSSFTRRIDRMGDIVFEGRISAANFLDPKCDRLLRMIERLFRKLRGER